MTRSRKVGFRIAAVCFGLILALVMGEVAIRAIVLATATKEVPVEVPRSGEEPSGFRDRLDSVLDSPGVVRIAFLGDSNTYGLGVKADQAFPRVVGALLEEKAPGRYRTINISKPGADLIYEWAIYNRVWRSVRPHVVVQVFAPNDLDVDLYKHSPRQVEPVLWPSRYSRLFALVETQFAAASFCQQTLDYLRGGATPQMRARAWRIVSHEIEATRKLVEDSGAVYALAHFPWLSDLDHHPLQDVHDGTAALAAKLGVPYLDLLDVFRGQDAEHVRLVNDAHPNPQGHRMAAEAVTEWLVRRVLPELHPRAASRPVAPVSREEILAAEVAHYHQVLRIDSECFSARFRLLRLRAGVKTP